MDQNNTTSDRNAGKSATGASRVPDDARFMGLDREEYRRLNLENIDDFREATTYHTPDAGQMKAHLNIRAAAQAYAEAILVNVPAGHDRMAALDQVRVSLFFSNAAIALRGRV